VSVLKTLIERFLDLPGIGPKSAERIAHYLVRRPPEEGRALAEAILKAAESLRPCGICSHIAESDPCPICGDPARDARILCVVETSRDLEALESSGEYRGRYHVLGGHVSPQEGVGLEDLNVATLLDRVEQGVTEVVLATNPTFEGEATAVMLGRELKARGARVTRIARGIPSGGEIVHMNGAVLAEALRGRAEVP
jgi:recombination protein RecR